MEIKPTVKVDPVTKRKIQEKLSELTTLLKMTGTEILYDQEFGNTYLLPKGYVIDNVEDPAYPEQVEDEDRNFCLYDLEQVTVPQVSYCPNYHIIIKP